VESIYHSFIFTMAECSWAPCCEQRCNVMCSIPSHASNFSPQDCWKVNNALMVRVIICNDHRNIFKVNSPKGVYRALILDEYLLPKIIILLFTRASVHSLIFLHRVQTPSWMSVTYISSLSLESSGKKIISALDRVPHSWPQEFCLPDFLIFVYEWR